MKPTPGDPLYRLWKVFPNLTENELQEMKGFFDGYISLCWKIYERIERDPAAMARLRAEIAKKKKQQNQGM